MTKVFISWSGEVSHLVAQTINEWLPVIIQNVEPFISSVDLEKGGRWGKALAEYLQNTNFGIICLTPDNLEAPWINFEAGALSKFVEDSRVAPLLVRVKPSDLPETLRQFNATTAEKDEFKKLVKAINIASGDSKIDDGRLDRSFESCWGRISDKLAEAEKLIDSGSGKKIAQKPPVSPLVEVDSILQELVVLARKQTQLLSSPENMFPESLLRSLLSRTDSDGVPPPNHAVWTDLSEGWERFSFSWRRTGILIEKALTSSRSPNVGEAIEEAWAARKEATADLDQLSGPIEYLLDRVGRRQPRPRRRFASVDKQTDLPGVKLE